ncbi:hypothetical protein HUS70_00610 [Pandoraea nosoerga]|uniref:Uncharacterized protein n=1 Tax=Pandoraea nosoerga TaxID=2508296 RepID=A0A5E4RM86_9BURK|nr:MULTISPECIES: hypothetical protein [Pandoraea]MBN4664513.1 hypothetical protein [Pandoraea nosoerga]MBN4674451.1 hypothetical protein [Pandoraea nosoerga]MBN4679719.1 hypothetical protein [Pandoraea nosoerga]MBN4743193.1 hypothetical protein [Pandoraea nosoerga]VVD63941.1 hypothetical protein PNO31109_00243 [Pandoraea nosoerga]
MTKPLSAPPSHDARHHASTATAAPQQRIDDEPLRLVTSFNDIFVVIASWLLSFGTVWFTDRLPSWLQMLISAAIAWGLSEIFVRRRRMTLPALWFSFSFVTSVALLGFGNASLLSFDDNMRASMSGWTLVATCACTAIGAALFWWRFRVPVVIAMGLAGIVITVWVHVLVFDANAGDWLLAVTVAAGLAIFLWALHWDAQDPRRTTIRSDVAFWLHLLAACMVTHPVFWALSPQHPGAVIAVFALLTVVSLVIDRRALMLSSLLYLLSAILKMVIGISPHGDDASLPPDHSMSMAAIVVGGVLLLLSVFWQPSRNAVLRLLPASWRARLPR